MEDNRVAQFVSFMLLDANPHHSHRLGRIHVIHINQHKFASIYADQHEFVSIRVYLSYQDTGRGLLECSGWFLECLGSCYSEFGGCWVMARLFWVVIRQFVKVF